MPRRLIEQDPALYLKMLLGALLILMLALFTIAIAEFALPPGLMSEGIALVALLAAAPALLIGAFSFLMLIISRLRAILRNPDE